MKKIILSGLLAGFTVQALSLDQERLQQAKEKAHKVLNRHEYMAGVYIAVAAGLIGSTLYTWNVFKPGYGETKPATKTWEEWAGRKGEEITELVYAAAKMQIVGYFGGLFGAAIAVTPGAAHLKNDVVSAFTWTSMPWYIQHHTQFYNHVHKAMEKAVYFDRDARSLQVMQQMLRENTMCKDCDSGKYSIEAVRAAQGDELKDATSREALLTKLRADVQALEQDCYLFLGAFDALQERDIIVNSHTELKILHYRKIEMCFEELYRLLDLSEEQMQVQSKQGKGLFAILYDLKKYVDLVFI